MGKRAWTIIVVIAVVGILGVVATWLYVFRAEKTDMHKLKTEYILDAGSLLREFQADESAATAKYAGKTLEVSGVVNSVEKNEWGNITITYIDPIFGVTCTIDSLEAVQASARISAVRVGDSLTVKGRCDGILTDVKLVNCIVLK